ncbi:MAG TPA: hypothetical protein VNT79_07740, partial [Phycisphaerae bacterium]|nr:hypothetical protein [Phycisphaerae bacterium]
SKPVTIRAEFELAKTLMEARQYDQSRRRLDRLSGEPVDRLRGSNRVAAFYVRLAPLIHAYTHVREARTLDAADVRRPALEEKARTEFVSLAQRGGAWQQMVQIYLDALAGKKRSVEQLSDIELAFAASQAMTEEKYAEAEKAWRVLLLRPQATSHHHEARFNLAVALFQLDRMREAAEEFLVEARSSPPPRLAPRTFEYAYRCWRQLSAESKSKDDFLKLAEAGGLLARELPTHPEAVEARWVAALALDEGGDYGRAISAYGEISDDSSRYWHARRNIARCRQRLYETIGADASADRRFNAADEAANEWLKLADDLAAQAKKTPAIDGMVPATGKKQSKHDLYDEHRERWIRDARFAACTLFLSEDLGRHQKALDLLEKLPSGPRVLGLQIRCLQALGDIKQANRILEDYLRENAADELGSVLVSLAAEMEAEVKRLQRAGRGQDARRLATETLPTIRHLLAWIESRPEHARHVSVVRFSYANMLVQADRLDEATREIESLMDRHPSNGGYLLAAARLKETVAAGALASDREDSLNQAEALWEKLLRDPTLLVNAPAEYWEARYHWLHHQLRRGHAGDVLKGIETERAWRPDLGGPPWQAKLLELVEQARAEFEAPPQ